MPEPWKCVCGRQNSANTIRCAMCGSILAESEAALAGRLASSPEGVPAHRGAPIDPATDPVCRGTQAYLDGITSGLSRPEQRAYYDWLAGEVKRRLDDNDDLMAEMESD